MRVKGHMIQGYFDTELDIQREFLTLYSDP